MKKFLRNLVLKALDIRMETLPGQITSSQIAYGSVKDEHISIGTGTYVAMQTFRGSGRP